MEKNKKYIIIGAAMAVLICALVIILWPKKEQPVSQKDKVEQNGDEGNREGLKVEETPTDEEGVPYDEMFGEGNKENNKDKTDKDKTDKDKTDKDKTDKDKTDKDETNKDETDKDETNKDETDKDTTTEGGMDVETEDAKEQFGEIF